MLGACKTGCFVMAAVGAFYLLTKRDLPYGRTFVRLGVLVGVVARFCNLCLPATSRKNGLRKIQPATLAAMKGFSSRRKARAGHSGPADVEKRQLDNPLQVPRMLSLLTYQHWSAHSRARRLPQQCRKYELFITVSTSCGTRTIFIAVNGPSVFLLWRNNLWSRFCSISC